MGRKDTAKLNRQTETIIITIASVYGFTELILGYQNGWNVIGQMVVLLSLFMSWVFFFGEYKTFEFRSHIICASAQLIMAVYGIEMNDFYYSLSVFVSLCILLGLYGMPQTMIHAFWAYTAILFHYLVIKSELNMGSYVTDFSMIMRILQGYLVIFVVAYLQWRYMSSESDLRETIDVLKESERDKDDFLANVSHEIRTPVNTICGISEIMLKNGVPNELKEDVLNIQSAGRNLVSVIGDILDYSELQEGTFEIVEEKYHISSTIYDIINMSMAKKSEKKLELIVDCDPSIPSVLIGDEQKIRRVVMNLVNNAIEFTNDGYISIHVGYREEDYGINLIVSVKDTGIGIAKADIEKLFKKFTQADMGRTREKGGVGLGLAIAQALVNKMGGFISVRSELGKGSEFRFVVPQKVFDSRPIAELPNASSYKLAVYINMEQFDKTEIRDEYTANIVHMIQQVRVSCQLCRNLSELKRWDKKEGFTHIFIGYSEYMEDPAFFDSLTRRIKVFVIIDYFNDAKIFNKQLGRVYKPFFVQSIINALKETEAGGIMEIENHQLYAPDAKVLVIDDNRMNIRVVEGLMREYGIQVYSALSGMEGIKAMESTVFDFVFLDHMMPEMDGVETLHAIRKKNDPYFRTVPVVALTANAIAGTREMLLGEGFDDFVAKPVENSVLQRTLKKYIPENKQISVQEAERMKAEREIAQKEHAKEQGLSVGVIEVNEELVDAKKFWAGEKLVVGDLDVAKGLTYCGNEENYLEILASQRDSGDEIMEEIQKLYDNEDWKNYTISVHGVKSSMMSIGAVALSEKAKSLELAGKSEKYDFIHAQHNNMMDEFKRVMRILNDCEYLEPKKEVEKAVNKTPINSEEFEAKLVEMENAMYELDGVKMEEILEYLGEFSYGGKDLQKELKPVFKKIEMSDLMAAHAAVVKIKSKLD